MNLECSSRGDKRYSAFYARVTIGNKTKSIEQWYQNSKRNIDGTPVGKGNKPDYVVCPWTGLHYDVSQLTYLYNGLWITYLERNPKLYLYARQFNTFSDMFRGKSINCQADVISSYCKDRENFIRYTKNSDWYRGLIKSIKIT